MADNAHVNPQEAGTDNPTVPTPAGEGQWVMNAINRLDERLEQRFGDLDSRIRDVEKAMSHFKGWLAAGVVFLVIVQIVLRFFDVSVAPR